MNIKWMKRYTDEEYWAILDSQRSGDIVINNYTENDKSNVVNYEVHARIRKTDGRMAIAFKILIDPSYPTTRLASWNASHPEDEHLVHSDFLETSFGAEEYKIGMPYQSLSDVLYIPPQSSDEFYELMEELLQAHPLDKVIAGFDARILREFQYLLDKRGTSRRMKEAAAKEKERKKKQYDFCPDCQVELDAEDVGEEVVERQCPSCNQVWSRRGIDGWNDRNNEPSEDDIFIEQTGGHGRDDEPSYTVHSGGKTICNGYTEAEMQTAIYTWMDKSGFYPGIWKTSRNGEPEAYSLDEENNPERRTHMEKRVLEEIEKMLPVMGQCENWGDVGYPKYRGVLVSNNGGTVTVTTIESSEGATNRSSRIALARQCDVTKEELTALVDGDDYEGPYIGERIELDISDIVDEIIKGDIVRRASLEDADFSTQVQIVISDYMSERGSAEEMVTLHAEEMMIDMHLITEEYARRLAGSFHGGRTSELYRFHSVGNPNRATLTEAIRAKDTGEWDEEAEREIDVLIAYLRRALR